jgi:hypothetical protein
MTAERPFCAWCIYRNGDLCTHPDSPVNQGSYHHYQRGKCGPVSIGELKCNIRTIVSRMCQSSK